MLLNWKEINLILKELNLEGSFIQQIYQPKHHILLFHLYNSPSSCTLMFSLSPSSCRLHTTTRKYPNPAKPQRFVSFLRAHVRGGRITKAYQVENERIVKLEVIKDEKILIIWIRLWGGAANMIVTDEDDHVLDACYRRPGRNEISGGTFNPEKNSVVNKNVLKKETVYTIRDLPGTGSFNEKIDEYFHSTERTLDKEKLVQSLTQALNEKEIYLLTSLQKAEEQRSEYRNNQRNKELGDLIMSSIQSIKKEDKWLIIEDFYNNNRKIEIELNPHLSPQENAGHYYEKYKNAKAQLLRIEQTIIKLKKDLEDVKIQQKSVDISSDISTLTTLKKVLIKKTPDKEITKTPGHHFNSRGFLIIVGKSAKENDLLLRKYAKGNDYWFHSRDYPGSYVFVKSSGGKSIPLEVMLDAGNLAIFYSKGKESGQGDVYYTRVKYLRRPPKGKTGKVIPTQEKNLFITLDRKRIENLKNSSRDLLNSQA